MPEKNYTHRKYKIFTYIILFLFFFVWTTRIFAQGAEKIFIVAGNETNFPDVAITFRAVLENNKVSENLQQNEINVYENDQEVNEFTLTKLPQPAPTHVVFILDRGRYSEFDEDTIKSAMRQFVQGGYFRDSIDKVTIFARVNSPEDRTETVLQTTTSSDTFLQAIDSLSVRPLNRNNVTDGIEAIETSLNDLSSLSESNQDNLAIIYISRLIEQSARQQAQIAVSARELAVYAAEQGTTIYSFHAARNLNEGFDEAMRAVSEPSGGEYIPLYNGRDNRANLDEVYQSVINQGIRYQVSYRSKLGTSSDRFIAIVPADTPASAATNTFSYSVSLEPPEVHIVSPENDQHFNRNPIYDETENTWNYDLNSISVIAEVTWSDGISRTIESVTLLSSDDGRQLSAIPSPIGNRFTLTWDITDITSEKIHPFPLQVRVVDEFGLSNDSPSLTAIIEVLPGNEVLIETKTETIIVPTDPCEIDPNSDDCKQQTVQRTIPWFGIGVLAIVTSVLGFGLYKARNELRALSPGDLRGVANVIKTKLFGIEGPAQALARLHIELARPELEGEKVDIYNQKLTLGRDPELCDVVLYPLQQESSVSRSHCTVQYDQGRFVITHHAASSITAINNKRIQSGSPVQLHDGDVIVLGQIAVKGARLRFERLVDDDTLEHRSTTSWPTDIFEDDANDIDPFEELVNEEDEGAFDGDWLTSQQGKDGN